MPAEPTCSPQRASLAERILRVASCALAVGLMLLFLFVALRRVRYPFELDRMESAMMTSTWRLAHGMPLYSAPSLDWVAFLYAPLYFYVAALIAKLTGLSYAALRVVSITSTLGSFGLIYALVLRQTRRHAAALVAAGLYAAMYPVLLGWFDIGRVDSLSVFFFLAAIYCTRWTSPIFAAFVWLLAFQTKQSLLPIALVVFLAEYQRPRRMILGLGSFTVLAAASVFLLNRQSHGWYDFYLFGVAQQIAFLPRLAAMYLPMDLLLPLGIAIALMAAALLVRPPDWRSGSIAFYGIVTLLIVAAIGFVRAHDGANVNALMPVYAWLAVLFGMALHRLLVWSEQCPQPQLGAALVWLLVLVQLAAHLYQPGRFRFAADKLADRGRFLDALRAAPGDVWVANHSYDAILAGKPLHPEMDAFDAVLKANPAIAADLRQRYEANRFYAVILDRAPDTYSPAWTFQGPDFRQHYGLELQAPGSGEPDQPTLVFLACDAPIGPLHPVRGWSNGSDCAASLPDGSPAR